MMVGGIKEDGQVIGLKGVHMGSLKKKQLEVGSRFQAKISRIST